MVKIEFDVSSQDAIYLIKFAELMGRAKARGDIGNGIQYMNPSACDKVSEIKTIIDSRE